MKDDQILNLSDGSVITWFWMRTGHYWSVKVRREHDVIERYERPNRHSRDQLITSIKERRESSSLSTK